MARWQINQARQDTALDQRIDGHITTKIQPLNEGIARIREELAYLMAKVEDATSNKIIGFSKLPTAEMAANLPAISATLIEARRKQLVAPPQAVKELRNKLAQVQPRDPQFWTVVSDAVSYQSFIARKMGLLPDADKATSRPCEFIHLEGGVRIAVDILHVTGCSQLLDNASFSNGTFENTIIIYKGGPTHLQNVTFKNCLFLVTFPGEALLADNGLIPNFTISTG